MYSGTGPLKRYILASFRIVFIIMQPIAIPKRFAPVSQSCSNIMYIIYKVHAHYIIILLLYTVHITSLSSVKRFRSNVAVTNGSNMDAGSDGKNKALLLSLNLLLCC